MSKQLVVINNKLSVIKRSLSVINKLLPRTQDNLTWWNALSQQWKAIFLRELEITQAKFDQNPQAYLAQLTQLTDLYLWGNPVDPADIAWLKSQLPHCTIEF